MHFGVLYQVTVSSQRWS